MSTCAAKSDEFPGDDFFYGILVRHCSRSIQKVYHKKCCTYAAQVPSADTQDGAFLRK
jgi:hypothetical protein